MVVAVVDDLYFISKLQETARQLDTPLTTVRAADFRLERLRQKKPTLAVFDLNASSGNSVELIRQLKSDAELKGIPVIAFLSHVQVELERVAREAGCDQVLPRSKFTANLPELLRRFVPTTKPSM
jgi:CheY-like chemotaxis protein